MFAPSASNFSECLRWRTCLPEPNRRTRLRTARPRSCRTGQHNREQSRPWPETAPQVVMTGSLQRGMLVFRGRNSNGHAAAGKEQTRHSESSHQARVARAYRSGCGTDWQESDGFRAECRPSRRRGCADGPHGVCGERQGLCRVFGAPRCATTSQCPAAPQFGDSRAMGEVSGLALPEPLADQHEFEEFHSGEASLDDWLRRRARANQVSGASRTYVVCDGSHVVGYYALASGVVTVENAPGRFRRNMPNPIPVAVLAPLAVAFG